MKDIRFWSLAIIVITTTSLTVSCAKESPIPQWAQHKAEIIKLPPDACENLLEIVNRGRRIPECHFDDLVDLNKAGLNTGGDEEFLRNAAAKDLIALMTAAGADGIRLSVISAFRDYAAQEAIWDYHISEGGKFQAQTTTFHAGFSEHHLGTSVDIGRVDLFGNAVFDMDLGSTEEYAWLQKNASRFQYFQRYPIGQEHITGLRAEAWHFRWLPAAALKAFLNSGANTYDEWKGLGGNQIP